MVPRAETLANINLLFNNGFI